MTATAGITNQEFKLNLDGICYNCIVELEVVLYRDNPRAEYMVMVDGLSLLDGNREVEDRSLLRRAMSAANEWVRCERSRILALVCH